MAHHPHPHEVHHVQSTGQAATTDTHTGPAPSGHGQAEARLHRGGAAHPANHAEGVQFSDELDEEGPVNEAAEKKGADPGKDPNKTQDPQQTEAEKKKQELEDKKKALQKEIDDTQKQLEDAQKRGDAQEVERLQSRLDGLHHDLGAVDKAMQGIDTGNDGAQGGNAERAPASTSGPAPIGPAATGGGAPSGGGGAPAYSGGDGAPSYGGGGSAAPVSGANPTPPPNLTGNDAKTAKFIDDFLVKKGSPAAGQHAGEYMVEYGKQNKVDPLILLAIAGQETQFGKTGIGVNGWMGVGAYDSDPNNATRNPHFSGVEQQIKVGAETFARLRAKGGASENDSIAQQTAVVNRAGWATDPRWGAGVANMYAEISKAAEGYA